MLPLVKTPIRDLKKYEESDLVSKEVLQDINKFAKPLKGLKVFHVNATPRGGGVAEIMQSLVPLMKGLGIQAEWYTIPPRNNFFEITKKIHNALQGKNYQFPLSARKEYMFHMARTAEFMNDMKPDIWVIHDPQPAGLILFLPHFHPAISRLHIDLTSPNQEVWKFFSGFLGLYDKVIFSSGEFVKNEVKEKSVVFQPAIDAFDPKNQPFPKNEANNILRTFSVNPDKPLISQVSRFDPWKDPLGVIEAYKLAKKKIPELQLAMVGFFLAQDDPEAQKVYKRVKKIAEGDSNIFLFAELEQLGSLQVNTFVNAVQAGSDIIIQKSTREGFGLVVTEAMWKEKAVIGGNVGGIKLQIKDGENGFLISNPKEAASRITQLITDPELCIKLGKEAKETVKGKFLMPRLLRDYLKLFNEVI